MFYRPSQGHGLPHSPFNAIVAPRPIGWISTRTASHGDNLAPYSFFNALAYSPPQVMFAGEYRDSVRNAQDSGVFAMNVVSEALLHQMNASAAMFPRDVDEFTRCGIEKAECETIDCPRVAASPATLECKVAQVMQLRGEDNWIVLAEVTGVHLADDCLRDGYLDPTLYKPVARLGYKDYTVVRDFFSLERPKD